MPGGMKLWVALASAALISTPARAELDLSRASVERLGNGLTLIMLEDRSFPLVSAQMLYKSGSRDESAGKTGLAHFLEHLAFRASERFRNGAATEAIYDSGGEWHGYTWLDQTTYYSTMPSGGLELLLRIEADRMASVTIDPAAIEAEKGAVITEMHGYENDPDSVLLDSLIATAIQAHPYRNNTIGLESDVAALTLEDSKDFYDRNYAPGNAVLAIAGDFRPAETRALVEKLFGSLPARAVPQRSQAIEPAQRGERRSTLAGPVSAPRFAIAFPAPAASSADLPGFLVLQELLGGGSGVNFRQNDWGTPIVEGSILHGAATGLATWLIPTTDPYLLVIKGSVAARADMARAEREIERRLGTVSAVNSRRLETAKAAVLRQLSEDVESTEDAAHQLAFFEGIGALDALLTLPRQVAAVTANDIRRLASDYLAPGRRTVAWMVPGEINAIDRLGAGAPTPAPPRAGSPGSAEPAPEPMLHRLAGGLPIIIQHSPLSPTVAVQLLVDAAMRDEDSPDELAGLGTITRSGPAAELSALMDSAKAALNRPAAGSAPPSRDPGERLQQLIVATMRAPRADQARPLVAVISGAVEPAQALALASERFATVRPGALPRRAVWFASPTVRERIDLPLAQGAIGYVVAVPPPATRQGLAARLLLYILTHDYSGRLGRSAITDKGLAYHIYSALRTDGTNAWATVWTGVDPSKADALEAELRAQLADLIARPPTAAEVEAAKRHLLGRDVSAAQNNSELASKLAREFLETGGLRSHADLERSLAAISVGEVVQAARAFGHGTVIRIDIAGPDQSQHKEVN